MRILLTDHHFAHDYVSRKRRGVISSDDSTEPKWPRPPRLRSIEWIFTPVSANTELAGHLHNDVVDVDNDSEHGETASEDPGDDHS